MSNDMETYEVSPKDSAGVSTVENESVVRKIARMLSQELLHIDHGKHTKGARRNEGQAQ